MSLGRFFWLLVCGLSAFAMGLGLIGGVTVVVLAFRWALGT